MTYKRKQITFWLSMISLGSLVVMVDYSGFTRSETFEFWFFWSLPLIINLIHYAVFREEKNDK